MILRIEILPIWSLQFLVFDSAFVKSDQIRAFNGCSCQIEKISVVRATSDLEG